MSVRVAEILLVEDDAAIRESLVECLELEGRTVRAAADGAEALAWLREGNRPRVVLLDLVMPGMGGEELAKRLRASPDTRGLPLVLMTGASPGQVGQAPVDAVLMKPFELADLLGAVRPFLDSPR